VIQVWIRPDAAEFARDSPGRQRLGAHPDGDVRAARPERSRLTPSEGLRALACRIAERYRAELMWLGAAGVLGFVGARLGLHLAWYDTRTYVAVVAASLASLCGSCFIARFGDRYELSRLRARRVRETR